ncbi:putative type VI secretion system effector [Iodobacter sp. CM08]|uniref:putative type VI secretion system effector n=1 Tax=Iodobacter sp. CM08 TaxID=3085902 RepID=UPI00298245D5|nr:putative type VI secretion system effector [Iodobacter sp. CM08]MDW5416319.1 putative type VI secretion system effector [Iodobacter sp. CM08]
MESASCLTNQVQMKKYQLIKGIVSDLQISHGYEDLVFTDSIKNTAGSAASAAALMGQVFNAGTLATASGGAEISMQFFTCKLDEKRVAGRFYKIGFKDGEEIEFVVEKEGDIYAVLAARSANQRLIWMLPQHLRGEKAHFKNDIKWTVICSIFGPIVFSILLYILAPESIPEVHLWRHPIPLGVAFVLSFLGSVISRYYFSRFGKATTPIFAALGYEHPESVDLPAISNAAHKRYKQEHGKFATSEPAWTWRY